MTKTEIAASLKAQFVRKNADYGDSAHHSFVRFGPLAYVVRLSDKFNRWESLLTNDAKVNNESLADTIGDAFTYICMWAAEIAGGSVGAVSVAMDDALCYPDENETYAYQTVRHAFDVIADSVQNGERISDYKLLRLAHMTLIALAEYAESDTPDLTKSHFKICDLLQYMGSESPETFTAYNHDLGTERQVTVTDCDVFFISEIYKDFLLAYDFGGEEYEIPASRVGEFRRVKLTPIVE